jgi:hypothetical protein
MHISWYCLHVGKSINYLIRNTSGQGLSYGRYCHHRSGSVWPLHSRAPGEEQLDLSDIWLPDAKLAEPHAQGHAA